MSGLKRVLLLGLAVAALLYPLLVYWGIQRFEPKYLGLAIAGVYVLRTFAVSRKPLAKWASIVSLIVFCICMWWFNNEYLLKILPALISLGALFVFTHSYIEPPTIPARIALRIEGELCEARLSYTNKITLVWITFFLINAGISLYTVFVGSTELWALYNGLISYMLMGALFAGEYLYRTFVFERRLQHES